MSLKIRPTHERIFNSVQTVGAEQPQDDLVEETVFLVDEETGEIVEERQMVPRDPSTAPPAPVHQQPPKDNKFIGLAMRKKSKVSFM
ncbi:MAG: hypothetical protein PHG66_01875 [Candidatus Colwellbacteria bacterium]|nr:hypothetical protein [Candidatus Colwellbacteria bacterium]